MNEFITVFDHGTKKIDLSHIGSTAEQLRPIELHHNSNGSIKDEPVFAIVLRDQGAGRRFYAQFTLETISDCLSQLGYEIKKI